MHLYVDDRQSGVMVPTGAVSLHLHALPVCLFLLEEIQSHMREHCEVFAGVAVANTAVVVAKSEVEHPMERVLYRPVVPNTLRYSLGIQAETADVVASLIQHRVTLGPPRLNRGHSLQSHPVLVSRQPRKVIGYRRATPFLPPVVWIVRLVGHVHDVAILPQMTARTAITTISNRRCPLVRSTRGSGPGAAQNAQPVAFARRSPW
jgi:hypothetical protein